MLKILGKIISRIKKISNESKFYRYRSLRIGAGTQFALDNLDGIAPQLIKIGRDCVLAPKCVVLTHDACLLPTTGKYIFDGVEIGDRVFVGYGAVIMPGVKIGDDVIVGSNAVVTKDIPNGAVVVGAPARIVGTTAELAVARAGKLQEPVFDWRKEITPECIVRQQDALLKQFQLNR
ncbi:acyltransferase [Variovorax sp. KBS0712]|uniref:acyltransferase n=1 Tax=Variovorax sp. KBS0712 TaxID=2578111 RepID=UPI00111ADFBB|nr:acyltransferase [Variovorax sp. KBS0712]TSD54710.1 acyltransferase [Variovorax sp. KBS0712]